MNIQSIDLHSDLMRAILWEHEEAKKLKTLAKYKEQFFNQTTTEFWENWYTDVFNIDTANDFGLAVWGRILNVPLGVDVGPSVSTKKGFGFSNKRGNFKSNFKRNSNYTLTLTKDQKRLLVRMRYFSLTNSPTVPNINRFLRQYFWRGESKVYVLDPLDMTYMYYVFNFNPDESLRLLLDNFDLLPRPSAVGVKYRIVTKKSFGFGHSHKNFNGNFGA